MRCASVSASMLSYGLLSAGDDGHQFFICQFADRSRGHGGGERLSWPAVGPVEDCVTSLSASRRRRLGVAHNRSQGGERSFNVNYFMQNFQVLHDFDLILPV